MALELILGSSGAGKSTHLYRSIINESIENPDRNYIVVVPEQYTMATQKKLVTMHPRKGILNIDVVSFDRLAYKVFEEVGEESLTVLDDTGKNLIVRRILEQNKAELNYFGSNLNNAGFVSEMKSIISEILLYNVKSEELQVAANENKDSQALKYKLSDINIIYNAFMEYIDKNYITKEEILDRLCRRIEDSKIIRNSQIVFDGFTGFTPIQYSLITILLKMCPKISVALTIDPKEKMNVIYGVEDLFFMSKDCISKLHKICDAEQVQVLEPVIVSNASKSRFNNSKDLLYLENNFLRNGAKTYTDNVDNIVIYEASVARDELRYVAAEIIKLTRLNGYRYKDIALVTADMDNYGRLAANIFRQNDIPFFYDQKRHISDNPYVETVLGALSIIENNYSYDSVFGYLRAGLTGIEREEVDFLDNYCVAVGIRGRKKWHETWIKKFRGSVNESDLEKLNELRARVIAPIDSLETILKSKEATLAEMTKALYDFMVEMRLEEKILELNDSEYTGDEYRQIYGKSIDLLDKMYELLGSEKVSAKEFSRIVSSGFEEIKIGLIPQTNDTVLIGDIERTRLDDIKVMFFVGLNDGNVPKRGDARSILSEMDREYLEEKGITMSPSSREKAFIQRYYLYLIMTKPSDKLYLSYAQKSSEGAPLLPSYIIKNIKKMFSEIKVYGARDIEMIEGLVSIPRADYAYEADVDTVVDHSVVEGLIDGHLVGSVSAFEKYASCRYRYYLQYELGLKEREEFEFSNMNFGVVVHNVIKDVCEEIKQNKESFYLISDERRKEMIKNSITAITDIYENSVLKDSNRNEFLIKRMTDLADRTLWVMGRQLKDGDFVPFAFEHKFDMEIGSGEKKQIMKGTIDRVDLCELEDKVYVRIIDYKTGGKDFNLIKTYYGLDIQLMVYMEAAIRLVKKNKPGKEVVPAGIFYQKVSDPIVSVSEETEGLIEDAIREELRLKGMVNLDGDIAVKMDNTGGKSLNIPVSFDKNGAPSSRGSKLLNTEQFKMLGSYVDRKSIDFANGILSGDVKKNPYKDGDYGSCGLCPYQAVCGFSTDLPGYSFRNLKKFNDEELWNNIKEGVDENGKKMD